jgi:hypothetical protein
MIMRGPTYWPARVFTSPWHIEEIMGKMRLGRGLVPISPKTTPSATRESEITPAFSDPGRGLAPANGRLSGEENKIAAGHSHHRFRH